MNMKAHILAALREQFEGWEQLLSSLGEAELTSPQFDLNWSIKDVMAHLWAWQQISIARLESGVQGREPEYPQWILAIGEDWEEDSDRVNSLTFEKNHKKPWAEVYQNWRSGFLHFLESGDKISERDLLDGDWYPWLKGHSLASILVASYDHHQEHLQKLQNWLDSKPHK
jgi:hypothetical protein